MTPPLLEPRDPAAIEAFLRRDPGLHLYELGDLDPAFWPRTRWFALPGDSPGGLGALALLYDAGDLPVLLALGRGDGGATARLVAALAPRLPARVYAHLAPGLAAALGPAWTREPRGRHLRMVLVDPTALPAPCALDAPGGNEVARLGPPDADALLALYAAAYPDHWFDPRMLATGEYFGARADGALVCAAGVHVVSRAQRVAALGNVATHPAWRGRGLARRVVGRLCRSLLASVDLVGLNVAADNAAAIACYARLGFAVVADYDEVLLARAPSPRRPA